jgi:transmembrane sensor
MLEHYSQPEDLLADGSFLNWYFKTGDGEDGAWEKWVAADSRNKELMLQAVALLDLTRLQEKKIPVERIVRASDRLLAEITRLEGTRVADTRTGEVRTGDSGAGEVWTGDTRAGEIRAEDDRSEEKNSEPEAANGSRLLPFYGSRRWIAAASVLVAMTTGLLVYRDLHFRRSEIRTEYGQLGQQVLPDGTEVTMNANSRLRLTPGWKAGADREVWIDGEAFFHVRRTPEKARFIVHLDDCDVIVTGTRFNVVNRPGKENVMLQEGAVILHAASGKELDLKPGDFVAVDKNGLEKVAARSDSLMAWKERRLILDNTPLSDLVNIVYDQYGVRIQLADDSTAKKTITAILPNNNLEVLLKSLEMTQDFEVTGGKDSGGITIVARPTRN